MCPQTCFDSFELSQVQILTYISLLPAIAVSDRQALQVLFLRFPSLSAKSKMHGLLGRADVVIEREYGLQMLRHLHVLASESRCMEAVNVETLSSLQVPITVTLKEGSSEHDQSRRPLLSPCLLPPLDQVHD